MGRPPKSDLSKSFLRILKTIGSNLRAQRELQGLSQSELARHSKVSLTTLNEIENQSFRDIRLSTLHGLAEELKIPVVSLFMESNMRSLKSEDRSQLLKASETILRITKKISKENDND